MIRRNAALLLAGFMALAPVAAPAVQPDEVLPDPALELRARELSKGLRCLVCRNESIDESNAGLARDLRLLVRERIVAGDSDDQVVAFIVSRYGEYVLLNPRADGSNLLLWGAGPLMLVIAIAIGLISRRRRSNATVEQLSEAEKARLAELMRD